MKLETSAAEATAADANYAYADYDARPDPDHRPMYLGPTLKAINSISAKGAVLDAGCGGGLFSVGLHKAGYDVFGMDLSPSGIRAAKQRNVGHFEISSLYEDLTAPFDVNSFDAIITIEVIEHLYSPTRFAECAYSALRPGGLLVVSTPYWGYFKNIVLAVTNRMDRSLTALWEGGHIKHFSRKTLTLLMENQGFEVVSFTGTGEGWRGYVPGLWNGMLMSFRKPDN